MNEPVSNVSVGVEGSFELPVITNEAGEFTVNVVSGDTWLNIAPSADYKKKRVYLNDRTDLKIFLTHNDIQSGDDVLNLLQFVLQFGISLDDLFAEVVQHLTLPRESEFFFATLDQERLELPFQRADLLTDG